MNQPNRAPRPILVLYAHAGVPASRANRQLAQAASQLAHVRVHDLYQAYPDFDIDVRHEQRLLVESALIVFQHPVQWYGVPSLLKEWFDVVLEEGWAYGRGAEALRGKDYWMVATAGGSADSYGEHGTHQLPFAAFLPPFMQTARLCGMRWLPPLIVHGARQIDDAALARHVADYRRRLATYPAWVP